MADNIQPMTLLCEGGLDTTENHLFIDQNKPGAASEIINYEVGLYGGYRRIDGYEYLSSDFPIVDGVDAEGAVLCVAIYNTVIGTDTIIAARKQVIDDTYKFYYLDATGWLPFSPGFTLDSSNSRGQVTKIRFAKVTFGNVNYIIFVDGINYPSVYDGTDWYQLQSSNTGTSISPGGDQMIDYPKYVTVFKNHVFTARDAEYQAVVCHSAPENILNWTAAAGGGQLLASFPVVALKPFREALYVWGTNGIKNITVAETAFVINDTAKNIGCVAPDSVIEINGDILFLAQDGIRTVSGTDKIGDVNLASISRPIQKYINELIEGYDLQYLNSVVIKNKSQFRFYVSIPGSSDQAVGVIGGIRESANGLGWEFFKLQGIDTSVTECDYVGNEETVLHGDFDGYVYKQESGTSFNGSAITSVYSTPYLSMGDILTRKLHRKVLVFSKPEGAFILNVSVDFDWGNPDVKIPIPYSKELVSTGVEYDSGAIFDGGFTYASETLFPVIEFDVDGSFKTVRYTFTTSGTDPSHTIQGLVVNFSLEGKR